MTHPQVGGYVLAGGRSSRMGTDKALLPFAGKPLLQRAVETLTKVCVSVHILSNNPALAAYGPLVPDLHPGCGPLGGIEAALLHTRTPWSLFLAVDMPFVQTNFLRTWIEETVVTKNARASLFTAEGRPQPTLCLLHRELAPSIEQAIAEKEYKLFPALEEAATTFAKLRGSPLYKVLILRPAEDATWFANLNTPEEFAVAEQQIFDSRR